MKEAKKLSKAFGYLYQDEVEALYSLALELEGTPVIVNIGAGVGTSGLAFAEAQPDAERYTIDICKSAPTGGLENERNAFRKIDIPLPTQILGASHEVAADWQGEIDLVFIDGDHSDAGVRGDINGWLPHIKKGGVIAFHDYESRNWQQVKDVIDELLGDYEMICHVDTVIAFRV